MKVSSIIELGGKVLEQVLVIVSSAVSSDVRDGI